MHISKQRLIPVRRLWVWASVAITTAGMLAGCAGGLLPPDVSAPTRAPPHASTNGAEVTIGVLKEGWHTGLVVPVAEMSPSLSGLHHWFPKAKYLVFGWGNRAFYTARHPGLGAALSALLPSASVVFVRGLPRSPETVLPPGAELRWVCAFPEEVSKLDTYLGYYLRKGPSGRAISVGTGPLPDSRFFASTGTYDAFHTCNTWTVAGLEFAGLPVSAEGIVFAGQVMSEIRTLRACHGQSASSAGNSRTSAYETPTPSSITVQPHAHRSPSTPPQVTVVRSHSQ